MRALFFSSAFSIVLGSALSFSAVGFAADGKKTRDEMVIEDRDELQKSDTWIYNDFDRAKAESKASGKPLMVVFRCIP